MTTSRKDFITEAEDLLENAQSLTLELQDSIEEGTINPDSVNALFRDMHTLKGLSGLFGLQWITDLSHRLESLLDDLRLGKVEATDSLAEFLLKNIDILRQLIRGAESDHSVDVSEYLAEIDNFKLQAGSKGTGISLKGLIDDSILNVLSEYEEHRVKANIQQGNAVYLLRAVFELEDFDKRLSGLSETIKRLGELLSTLPTSDDVPAGSIGFNLLMGSEKEKEVLSTEMGYDIEVLVPPREEKKAEDTSAGSSLKSISTTVRVDIEKLDRILNTVGEISLAKGAVKRIAEEFLEEYGHERLVMDIYKVGRSLERRVSELQDQVLDIRMIPIGQIFSRLAQVIRRYSRQMKKKIILHMFGEDTNIDKYLAEEAVDPLMHIIRNAIDHGIESEEERAGAGKTTEGNITLKAYQRGNHVVIEVKDDGRGIDIARVREKAFEKGLIERDREYTEKEIMEFLYAPGFSTSDQVTEVSGRGVGMDVVRNKISKLGGFVSLESLSGKGTTISITLPITLAILKALMVRVGPQRFAIPLTSIAESLMVQPEMLQTIEGRMIVNLRGEMIPVIYIGEILDVAHDDGGGRYAIVVGYDERRIGLLIDEMFGQHEIVIKSLGDYFAGLRGFAGASEVGKHEIVLVMDTEAIIDIALIRHKEGPHV
jgi:two-component system chemotaxis sensor kinase CheA